MYGIFAYIWLKFMVNVGKYTMHGAFGIHFEYLRGNCSIWWWKNQPISKILVKLAHFPNFRDEHNEIFQTTTQFSPKKFSPIVWHQRLQDVTIFNVVKAQEYTNSSMVTQPSRFSSRTLKTVDVKKGRGTKREGWKESWHVEVKHLWIVNSVMLILFIIATAVYFMHIYIYIERENYSLYILHACILQLWAPLGGWIWYS